MSDITYVKKRGAIRDVVNVYPCTNINPQFTLPPKGAEYLQAGIVEAGRNATLLDMRFENDIRKRLERTDLVCLYGFCEDCSIFGKWGIHAVSEVINQIPWGTPVIAGGTGFLNLEDTLNAHPKIDIVLPGMSDTPVQELLASDTPETVPNVVYRRGGQNDRTSNSETFLSDDVYPKRSLRNPK